jgi:hypothetical protein
MLCCCGDAEDTMKTLDEILLAVDGYVDAQKLSKLRKRLESATKTSLSAIEVSDPIKIRMHLIAQLESEVASRGSIQAYEQLFMGIIRRAALMGLVETPPEGPWSLEWQRILETVTTQQRGKSTVRSLAAWSTAKGLEPKAICESELREWLKVFAPSDNGKTIEFVQDLLADSGNRDARQSNARRHRLTMKATVGSVRDLSEVYAYRSRATKERRTKGNDDHS